MFDVSYKHLDHGGVERFSGHTLEQSERLFAPHPCAVGSVATRRVVKICDRDDARDQRYSLALESFGIARAVPLLMMMTDYLLDRVRESDAADDACAH